MGRWRGAAALVIWLVAVEGCARPPCGVMPSRGVRGPEGPKGDQGDPGGTGPQGVPGARGATGPQGAAGGDQGATGPTGPAGPTGAAGPQGNQGPAGDQGHAGATGPAGTTGPTGPQGAQGAVGPQGGAGPTGPQGAQGSPGTSGPQGARGAQGDTGTQGSAGAQGVAGAQGTAGSAQGAAGAHGAQGAQGAQGPTGPQGATGCATFTEVVAPNCASGFAMNATCGQTRAQICLPAASVTTSALSMVAFSTGNSNVAPSWAGGVSGGTYRPTVVGFGQAATYAAAVAVVGLQKINGDAVGSSSVANTYAWVAPMHVTIRALAAEFVATVHTFSTPPGSSRLRIALYVANDTSVPQTFSPTAFSLDIAFATSQTGIVSPFQHFRRRMTGAQNFTAGTRFLLYAIGMPGAGAATLSGTVSFVGGLSAGIAFEPNGSLS